MPPTWAAVTADTPPPWGNPGWLLGTAEAAEPAGRTVSQLSETRPCGAAARVERACWRCFGRRTGLRRFGGLRRGAVDDSHITYTIEVARSACLGKNAGSAAIACPGQPPMSNSTNGSMSKALMAPSRFRWRYRQGQLERAWRVPWRLPASQVLRGLTQTSLRAARWRPGESFRCRRSATDTPGSRPSGIARTDRCQTARRRRRNRRRRSECCSSDTPPRRRRDQ